MIFYTYIIYSFGINDDTSMKIEQIKVREVFRDVNYL